MLVYIELEIFIIYFECSVHENIYYICIYVSYVYSYAHVLGLATTHWMIEIRDDNRVDISIYYYYYSIYYIIRSYCIMPDARYIHFIIILLYHSLIAVICLFVSCQFFSTSHFRSQYNAPNRWLLTVCVPWWSESNTIWCLLLLLLFLVLYICSFVYFIDSKEWHACCVHLLYFTMIALSENNTLRRIEFEGAKMLVRHVNV